MESVTLLRGPMRLDKFLSNSGFGSRSIVKRLVYGGAISINGSITKSPDVHINEEKDKVTVHGEPVEWKKERYYVLYKPQDVICALHDENEKTVIDLLPPEINLKNLIISGRLDKDTEGLLLLTTDGKFSHWLLSPKHHIHKTYFVKLAREITDAEILKLEKGVTITDNHGEKYQTMPAKAKRIAPDEIELTIEEGKFHQVKKMALAIKNEVLFLKRIRFGKLEIGNMQPGELIEITKENII